MFRLWQESHSEAGIVGQTLGVSRLQNGGDCSASAKQDRVTAR